MWYTFQQQVFLLYFTLLLFLLTTSTTTELLETTNNKLSTIEIGRHKTFIINTTDHKSSINDENTNNNESNLHASLNAFETLRQTFKGVEKLVYHLLNDNNNNNNNNNNNSNNMPKDSNDVSNELLTYNAEKALKIIGGQMFEFSNKILTDVFERLQEQVDIMKNIFEHMTDDVINNFDLAVNYLNVTVMNHSEEIDNWAADFKQKLRTVNNTEIYKNGCKKVDKIVATSTKLLRKCCNVTVRPLKSFCWKTRSIFSNTLTMLVDKLERIQLCIEDRESYKDYLMKCINVVYNDISNLIERAITLRKNIVDSIPLRLMISRECFSVALVHIEEHQIGFTRNLTSLQKKKSLEL